MGSIIRKKVRFTVGDVTKNIDELTDKSVVLMKKNVHYLRKRVRGMTFEDLAESLNVSRDSLFRLENDKDRVTNLKTLVKLVLFFDVSMDDLLFKNLEYESMKEDTQIREERTD